MLVLLTCIAICIAQERCLTTEFLITNDVPFKETRNGQETPIKIGQPIWASGQTSAHLLDILVTEVLGFQTELVQSASYASGPLFFDTLPDSVEPTEFEVPSYANPGTLDLVIEIWDTLNPTEIASSIFTDFSVFAYNTLGYESGDGLFVPKYTMNSTFWASKGVDHPELFTSMYDTEYVTYFSRNRTGSQWKDWIMQTSNLTARFSGDDCGGLCEPTFYFQHESCENNPCVLWIMLDPGYMYNRYQSLVRNWGLPVVILTWSYMDTVSYIIPALFNAEQPFMTMSFFPDTFQLQYELKNRIYFPQATNECLAGQNSTSTQGFGTYNCGFEKTKNWKFGSIAFHHNPLYEDLHTNGFLHQLTIPDNDEMDSILRMTIDGRAPAYGFRNASCTWLRSNVAVWKQWIFITPDEVKFPLEKMLGITIGALMVVLGLAYFAYKKFGSTTQLDLRLFQAILFEVSQIVFETADFASDAYILFSTWIPTKYGTAGSGIDFAILYAGVIVTITAFVLIWAIYRHTKEILKLWNVENTDETRSRERSNTLHVMRQHIAAQNKVIGLDIGNLKKDEPEEDELEKNMLIGEELDMQFWTIKTVLHDIKVHGIFLIMEDLQLWAINLMFIINFRDLRHLNATWIAFCLSSYGIGYKVSEFALRPYLKEFLNIITLLDSDKKAENSRAKESSKQRVKSNLEMQMDSMQENDNSSPPNQM